MPASTSRVGGMPRELTKSTPDPQPSEIGNMIESQNGCIILPKVADRTHAPPLALALNLEFRYKRVKINTDVVLQASHTTLPIFLTENSLQFYKAWLENSFCLPVALGSWVAPF